MKGRDRSASESHYLDEFNRNKRVDDLIYQLQVEAEELETRRECLPKKADEIESYKRKMIER